MSFLFRSAGIALAASAAIGGMLMAPSAQAAPAKQQACTDWSDPSGLANPTTARSVRSASGVLYELRYHDGTGCAWGRISNGRKYDSIWLDRARNIHEAGAGRWEPRLGFSMLGTDTGLYTAAFDDNSRVMRACGEASGQIVCTDWW
ncbi:hypothetical protein QQY66_48570 [Streptomyces sp. DG2A-72]|uniref:hypothetical protein n=1 Tax=Streptomyces sp. DG2A-72 TaxID=3051386 RepID=UPI00265BF5EE|nr:hypothetical protein [Streptomyces sp. DG2A-72]MDO0939177.1 hypothetical protein [Streptomyces sp. DG2A-72]